MERVPEVVAEADQWSFQPRDERREGSARIATIQASSEGLIDALTWSSDHSAFFVLREQGVLHRVLFPSLVEEYRLDLWEPASALQLSKLGLVIATPGSQQVRVVDESTLQTTRVMFVPGVYSLASAPTLSVAYSVPRDVTQELSVVDLGRKRVVRTLHAGKIWYQTKDRVSRHRQGVALTDFKSPTVSPDGKYLFCVGFECLHRFRVSGTSLEYEQMGPRLGSPRRIEISPDGRYVALPVSGGSRNLADHPQLPSYSVFVYRTLDLLRPVVGVTPGAYPTALGFDPSRGNLYVNNHESQLVTMDARGRQLEAYLLTEKGDRVRQFLPHPNGRDLLVLTDKKLLWVSWS